MDSMIASVVLAAFLVLVMVVHVTSATNTQTVNISKSSNSSAAPCCKPCLNSKLPPNITVYNYLSIQGPNSTKGYNTVQCGQALRFGGSSPQTLPYSFGQQYCFDMPLLLSKDLKSKVLGHVQGTFTFVSLADLSPSGKTATLFVAETFTFNTTFTAQGSFTAVGLEQIGMTSSKPLTGGTGDFALVSGVATTTPLSNGTDPYGNFASWFKYVFTFNVAPADISV